MIDSKFSKPLRNSVFFAGFLGFLGVSWIAVTVRSWLQLGAIYPGKAVVLFAVIMAIVGIIIGPRYPFPRFGPANYITMVRAMLVALIAALIGEPSLPRVAAAAVSAAILMAVLDGADGWFARHSHMTSNFGARFDMETDALFVMVMSILVWQNGKAGGWVIFGGVLRYAFVTAGWLYPWMARPLQPTTRGRIAAVCHMVGLIIALAPLVPIPFSVIAVGATLAVLSWSFALDIRRLWLGE